MTVNPENPGEWRLASRLHLRRMYDVDMSDIDNAYRFFVKVFGDIRNLAWATLYFILARGRFGLDLVAKLAVAAR